MKRPLLLTTLVLALASNVFAGPAPEQAYLELYRGKVAQPKPIAIVYPVVSSHYAGTEFDLVFSVDERGRPRRVAAEPSVPPELEQALVNAVRRWKFDPARSATGEARSAKVRLPVHIVPPGGRPQPSRFGTL